MYERVSECARREYKRLHSRRAFPHEVSFARGRKGCSVCFVCAHKMRHKWGKKTARCRGVSTSFGRESNNNTSRHTAALRVPASFITRAACVSCIKIKPRQCAPRGRSLLLCVCQDLINLFARPHRNPRALITANLFIIICFFELHSTAQRAIWMNYGLQSF